MWIVYYFYPINGHKVFSITFSGNAHQRRKDARMIAKSLNATYRIYKYAKGSRYDSGSFIN